RVLPLQGRSRRFESFIAHFPQTLFYRIQLVFKAVSPSYSKFWVLEKFHYERFLGQKVLAEFHKVLPFILYRKYFQNSSYCSKSCVSLCMTKQREQILLEPEQKQKLQNYSDQTGIPKTEIVRRALDSYFKNDWADELPEQVRIQI